MTDYEDFKPFFDAMIAKMKDHDHNKGNSWKRGERYMAYNLRTKLWEEFTECIEFNDIEDTRKPDEFVDLANVCAMIYLRSLESKAKRDEDV